MSMLAVILLYLVFFVQVILTIWHQDFLYLSLLVLAIIYSFSFRRIHKEQKEEIRRCMLTISLYDAAFPGLAYDDLVAIARSNDSGESSD